MELGESQEQVCQLAERRAAVFSIGMAATFGAGQPQLIEAHLLEGEVGELYGKWIAMDFVERLRAQFKFESEKELIEQIEKDCQKAGSILKS